MPKSYSRIAHHREFTYLQTRGSDGISNNFLIWQMNSILHVYRLYTLHHFYCRITLLPISTVTPPHFYCIKHLQFLLHYTPSHFYWVHYTPTAIPLPIPTALYTPPPFYCITPLPISTASPFTISTALNIPNFYLNQW